MKLVNKTFCVLFALNFSFLSVALSLSENNEEGKGENNLASTYPKDTLPAVVMYGKHLLFENLSQLTDEKIISLRDSLLHLDNIPYQWVKNINIYLDIKYMNDEEIIFLIDSLFDLNDVPYPLINQINLYISKHYSSEENDPPSAYIDTSIYPANQYYNSWNTEEPNPYSDELSKQDTLYVLTLQDTISNCFYVPPVQNSITSNFGWREGRLHKGIDIDLEVRDTVRAAFSGMVRFAKRFGGFGRIVIIRHYNGLETYYAHLHRINVKENQIVEAGEVIGLGGSSGHSSGSHLHFECRFKGIPINPRNFISFQENKLKDDTLVIKKTNSGYAAFAKNTPFYIVRKGDNLYEIAKKYGTTTKKLCELNGIKKNSYLFVGQKIRII